MLSTRVQVVVAHPDDETFGCGSLLLHAASAGAVTAVCCATRGEAGEPPVGSTLTPAELGEVRARELADAAALLAVSRLDLLDFVDSGMTGSAGEDTLAGAPFQRVVDTVRARLEAFGPDVVVTLDGSDGHRDHVRIRDATLACARDLGIARAYVQCLPRSLMRRWIEHMQVDRPGMEHLDLDLAGLGTPDADITTVIDTERFLTAREAAIAAHASQTSPFEGLPADLRRVFLSTDHLRRVVPPWAGGPTETTWLTD